MNQHVPYGFKAVKALGMVPMAPDHIAELALIEMSRMQRDTLERWNDALLVAGLTPDEANAICPPSAQIINLEARKAK
ncbi:MAG: hypothetical protein WBA88_13510 [Pseudaminobacter sp.]